MQKKIGKNLYTAISKNRLDLRKKEDRVKVMNKLFELKEIKNCVHCDDIFKKFENELAQEKWAKNNIKVQKPTKKTILDEFKPFVNDCNPVLKEVATDFCNKISDLDFRKNEARQNVLCNLKNLTMIPECDSRSDFKKSISKLTNLFDIMPDTPITV